MHIAVSKVRLSSFLLNNIELVLTLVGLIVILVVPRLLGSDNPWYVMALTATIVGVLHGLIFWVVRRRQRLVRQQTIGSVRLMMQDLVKNHLSVILTSTFLASRNPADNPVYVTRINDTVEAISSAQARISAAASFAPRSLICRTV